MANRSTRDTAPGQRVLITGGASGIGLATARSFARRDAAVAVLDVAESGPEGTIYVRADVRDRVAVETAVETAVRELGGLDVLVNNAGVGARGSIEGNTDDEWLRVFDINVFGLVRVTQSALPALRRSGAGVIVNTCSIAATAGLPDRVLYSATKGAVLSMTLAMAADLVREGVRVNAVTPGTVDTPWVGRLLDAADDPAAERASLEARQPHGRLVSVGEVAAAIVFLASPDSGSTTGTSLAVDGGMSGLRLRPVHG